MMNRSLKKIRWAGIAIVCCGFACAAFGLFDPDRPEVDLELLRRAAVKQVCVFMKRQNPHIKNWKKGPLPTKKEMKALLKAYPKLEKTLDRVTDEFLQEVTSDPEKLKIYYKKKTEN